MKASGGTVNRKAGAASGLTVGAREAIARTKVATNAIAKFIGRMKVPGVAFVLGPKKVKPRRRRGLEE